MLGKPHKFIHPELLLWPRFSQERHPDDPNMNLGSSGAFPALQVAAQDLCGLKSSLLPDAFLQISFVKRLQCDSASRFFHSKFSTHTYTAWYSEACLNFLLPSYCFHHGIAHPQLATGTRTDWVEFHSSGCFARDAVFRMS